MQFDSYVTRNVAMRIISFITGCTVTVTGFCVSDLGAAEQVSLQANGTTRPFENSALDVEDDSMFITNDLPEPGGNLEGYTFLLSGMPDTEFVYDGKYCYVNEDNLELRLSPDKDSTVTSTVDKNSKVLRVSTYQNWSFVRLDSGEEGYCNSSALIETAKATATPTPTKKPTNTPKPTNSGNGSSSSTPTKKPTNTPKPTKKPTTKPTSKPTSSASPTKAPSYTEKEYSATVYTTASVNGRTGPGTEYTSKKVYSAGTKLTVVAETSNGWYKLDNGYYVKASYTTTKAPTATPTSSGSSSHDKSLPFADYVKSFLGVKYVYGQSSATACDCSGLVKYVFSQYYGKYLPHGANSMLSYGKQVSTSEVQCGDLIFFDYTKDGRVDHVGIYIGGDTVIHASESRGKVISSVYSKMTCIYCARRVL